MLRSLFLFVLVGTAVGDPIASSSSSRLSGLNPYTPNGRIVGGRPTSIKEMPHQVSLQASGFAFCGGSIISPEWVITAGHCVSYPADWITIRAGSSKKSTGGSLHKVHSILRHENYRTNGYGIPENDIALIRLSDNFDLDETRQPIRLFDENEEAIAGVKSTITGWGALVEGGGTPDDLRTVDVPIISKSQCNSAYSFFGGIPAGQICAAYPDGGRDACQGDSGGPMAIDGRLAGVVSWGNGCARPGYPGVYTEIAYHRQWIASKTGL